MPGPRRVNPPFRGDHVGSFLRPERLKQARRDIGLEDVAIDNVEHEDLAHDPRITDVEDDCIRELVAWEEGVGVKSITDGELRRTSWAYDLIARIEGVELKRQAGVFKAAFSSSGSQPPIAHTVGKLGRRPDGIVLKDYEFLKPLTDRTIKVTIPTPTLLYVRGGREAVSSSVYPDIEEFFEDVGQVYRDEIGALADAGCTYVQIDNTDTALICDPKYQAIATEQGMDPQELIKLQARMVSSATKNRPDGVTFSMHLCRGNAAGNWLAEGSYEFVAETLFNEFDIDAFFLEYDTERAGDFTPLRFVPDDRLIVLGLITTKTPENDSKETILRRIDEAAKYVPLEQLALSPQCGFASGVKGNPITLDDQKRKLELVFDIAHEVWGET